MKRYAAHVASRGVAPNTIRLQLAPVKALFATAVEEGLIRSNPASGVKIPVPEVEPEERVKALSQEELRRLLGEIPDEWRLFFELLAETGLRIGEAAALTWADLDVARRRVQAFRPRSRSAVKRPARVPGRPPFCFGRYWS